MAAGAQKLAGTLDAAQLWGTRALVLLTTLVFIGQIVGFAVRPGLSTSLLLFGGARGLDLTDRMTVSHELVRFGMLDTDLDAVRAEPFRLLSAVFVHVGGLLHYGFNMLGLISFGRVAEPGIGSARFVIAYVITGIAGFALDVAMSRLLGASSSTAGASGAVFGAMGLVLGWLLRMRDPRWKRYAIQTVGYGVLWGFMMSAAGPIRINNAAHIGGLVAGILFGIVYASWPKPRRQIGWNVGAVVCVLLSVASLLMAQHAARQRNRALEEEQGMGALFRESGGTLPRRYGVREPAVAGARVQDRLLRSRSRGQNDDPRTLARDNQT